MALSRKYPCIGILILLINNKICLHGAPAEGSVINKELNGKQLIKMGNLLNKPLLSLLGATFERTEQNVHKELERIGATQKKLKNGIDVFKKELCKQTRYAAWTGWSACSAFSFNTFGARARSRTCGGNSSICYTKSAETVETDYQICQGTCKHTVTNNNYCIKLQKSVKKTQADAKDDCQKDGGYLMNIDSALKAKDLSDYFRNLSFSSDVWIDGARTLPNGDWKYEYGSKDTTFSIWAIGSNGEPDRNDDCKTFLYSNGKSEWWGKQCTDTFYYLCELV